VRNLVRFAKSVVAGTGARGVGIDWHGHNDRGFALENAIWALEYGADRVHATGLGIGERVGNAPMELLLEGRTAPSEELLDADWYAERDVAVEA
jgi:2-isopropylmalate synthase